AAKISSAPLYAPISSFFGRGIVGGYMDSFEAHGVAAADLALDFLSGKVSPGAPGREVTPLHQLQVDARQLERWGLSSRNLSPATVLQFQDLTIWERHRDVVLVAALVIALQSALVTVLLIQRRRRQKAEASLMESEERMTFTAAAVNVGLWQFDRRTDELWATKHCRALFGLPDGVPLTRDTFLGAIHPEDRDIGIASLRDAWRIGHSATTDLRIVPADGKIRWIRVRARTHTDSHGAENQVSGIFIDITDQK